MGMVAPQQRIASAFFVFHGRYGDVSRYAQQRGVCRQWVYREAARVQEVLTHAREQVEHLRAEVRQLRQDKTELQQRLRQGERIKKRPKTRRFLPICQCLAVVSQSKHMVSVMFCFDM